MASSEDGDVIVVRSPNSGGIKWLTLGDNVRLTCSNTLKMLVRKKYFNGSTTKNIFYCPDMYHTNNCISLQFI